MTVAVIVLAAGTSSRLGQPKQLLELAGKPVIRHVVDAAMAADVGPVVVVTGAVSREVERAVPHKGRSAGLLDVRTSPHLGGRYDALVRFVHNPDFAEGQGTSLARGVSSLADEIDACVVILGDQPRISPAAIGDVVAAWRSNRVDVVQAKYADGYGHPVLFDRVCFGELAELSGDVGGKEVVKAHRQSRMVVPVSGKIPADIDTVEDWESIKRQGA